MKKILALLLITLFVGTLLPGCAGSKAEVKTGLAVLTSIAKSKDATADADGLAQVDSTIVTLTVDEDGKIVQCVIDGAQTKINFNATGQLITPTNTEFKTKNELGTAYGMKGVSGIGKEWNEQAATFADYVKGKTIDEVKAIAVDEDTKPTGSDLKSSVTVSIGGFITAIEKAVANAKSLGAKADDNLKLGVATNIAKSVNAGEEAGLAQAYSTYTVVTTDADGKITSCVIDSTQGNVNFDTTGKITSDLTASIKTKNELGDSYGMKNASDIGKEWHEQAAAFAEYVKGKTASEVSGIAVDEKNHPTDSDLKSSVTVSIGDFKKALAKAIG
ncbi:MAG: hypothetical protein A2Y15_01710 [Clostridiales bacterium GWF2_36_10]|nr:MAG: hypothetical protein A2Y15_01710 [Clostridiales bacterium GWF2_36_10]